MTGADCAAPPARCGTASGWRGKGRCPRCRQAHNEDTAARRRAHNAPAPEVIAAFVRHLQSGDDPTGAARRAGIHPTRARALAQDHPEVAQALAGENRPASQHARQIALLRALLDHGGNISRAATAAGVAPATATLWRQDPAFDTAVEALRVVLGRPAPGRRRDYRHATEEGFQLYLHYRGQGLSQERAAKQAGISVGSVYYRASKDPGFAARLAEISPVVRRGPRPAVMAVSEERLRDLWADAALTLAAIAQEAGLTVAQLRSRSARMGLPARGGLR
ncbi:MAG: hypothetical protein HOZ81_50520 [Streptomyces sp.]|nr:hypothetical protein [Streptomyces sp.]NUS24410.1 hypothetical protein [Streptomyces sp.]